LFFVSPVFVRCFKYLREVKGLTETQLDNTVWPADTYATFAFMIPVGLLAEAAGYRAGR
jgi:hypothetical protein